jgi:hypothetical protein
MPKCPKCGKEIDYLYCYAYKLEKARFYISSNNRTKYSNWKGICRGDLVYDCPKCGELLFASEEEAEKFLRGNSNERRDDLK